MPACDETDKDFVIIARTDTCGSEGLEEAVTRLNMAADVGADMGMFFPRNDEEIPSFGPAPSSSASVPLIST
jgi:2-methylisocitrate lyase-like PEP mutase family enzyme